MDIVDYFRPKQSFSFNDNVSVFCTKIETKYCDFDFDVFLPTLGVNLQRGLVWCLNQKREFIYSCLKGNDFGKVHLIEIIPEGGRRINGKSLYEVIDGKQRLSTILAFINNEFTIEVGSNEYYFGGLDKPTQYAISHWEVTGRIAYSYHNKQISDRDKLLWFKRVNFMGTSQERDHMDKLETLSAANKRRIK